MQVLVATGLAESLNLSNDGPYTIFAPTDSAFDEIPSATFASLTSEELTQVLGLHVASGVLMASDLLLSSQGLVMASRQSLEPGVVTINDDMVPIVSFDDATLLFGPAEIIETDFLAANG